MFKKRYFLSSWLLAEQLREPAFNKEDLKTLKTRLVGNLKRDKENTQTSRRSLFTKPLSERSS